MAVVLIAVLVVVDMVLGVVLLVDARRSRRLEDQLTARRARARRLALPVADRPADDTPPFGEFIAGWSWAFWVLMTYCVVVVTFVVGAAEWSSLDDRAVFHLGILVIATAACVFALQAERWAMRWHDDATPPGRGA